MLEFINGLTFVHVFLGSLAVLAGSLALASRKGGKFHIKSGRSFAITMGLASLLGAILGLVKMEDFYITFHAGVLGVTLIASSWLTICSPRIGGASYFVGVMMAFPLKSGPF